MKPPRMARRLLDFTLPADERTDVLLNLDDLYAQRRSRHGLFKANVWYWNQALTFSARLRTASPTHGRRPKRLWSPARRVNEFLSDLRYGVRALVKNPSYTVAAGATLALGIGANALIFAFVKEAVLKPLPYPESDNLVWVWPSGNLSLTQEQFGEVVSGVDGIAELSAFAGRSFAMTSGELPTEVYGVAVTTNHFEVFGIQPKLGRGFYEEDGYPGAEPVVVLGYDLWNGAFNGDSTIIGSRIDLYTAAAIPMIPGAFTGQQHTVVGVMPPMYQPFGTTTDVLTPLVIDGADPAFSSMGELLTIARLRNGASAGQLQGGLSEFSKRSPLLQRMSEDISAAEVVDLRTALVGSVRPAMFVTLGAVGLVLLIACANVTNLSLVRTQARTREFAMRRALGASSSRLMRQLLTESLVLTVLGATIGFAVAAFAFPLAQRIIPHSLGIGAEVTVDPVLILFCIGILFVTVLLCGLMPALRHSRAEHKTLMGTARHRSIGRAAHRLSAGIATVQIALALALAYSAALLVTSFSRLTQTTLGFDPSNVMTVRVAPSEQRYSDADNRRGLFERVLMQTRDVPGVVEAGAIHFLPIADGGPSVYFMPDPTDPEGRLSGSYRVITPGYLETMRIPVMVGRTISTTDVDGSVPVGLINRQMAEQIWPNGNALGRTLYRSNGREWFTVVGIVGDVQQSARGLPPRPEIYLPLAQSQWASSMTIVARTTNRQAQFGDVIAGIVHREDANVPITRSEWMEDIMRQSVASPLFYTVLFSLFALLSLVLGAIGVYGVAAYLAFLRREETGIQLALGATRGQIIRGAIQRGGFQATLGILGGVVLVFVTSRFFDSLLFGVSRLEPILLGSVALLLAVIAGLGTLLPVHRATRMDPMTTLRPE